MNVHVIALCTKHTKTIIIDDDIKILFMAWKSNKNEEIRNVYKLQIKFIRKTLTKHNNIQKITDEECLRENHILPAVTDTEAYCRSIKWSLCAAL